MRSAVFLCVCAFPLVTGCMSTRPARRPTAEQQWEALCLRMPQRRPPVVAGATRQTSLTREQETVLRRVASEALDVVVRVKTACPDRGNQRVDPASARAASACSGGTGVVVSSDGLILTNEHVVRHAHNVTVVFHNGDEYPVEMVVVHPRQDLALLRVARTRLPAAMPSVQPVKSGTPVVAVSTGIRHRDHRYRLGIVTCERRSLQRELDPAGRKDYGDLVETSVRLEPGFSGGPLFDAQGHLVGLNVAVAGSPGTDRLRGYAIPSDRRLHEAIGQLVASARAAPPRGKLLSAHATVRNVAMGVSAPEHLRVPFLQMDAGIHRTAAREPLQAGRAGPPQSADEADNRLENKSYAWYASGWRNRT